MFYAFIDAVFLAPLSLTVFPVYTLPGARHTPLC